MAGETDGGLSEVLAWAVFQGAVCYARNRWPGKLKMGAELAVYEYTWDLIWRMQRQMSYPPVGLIRSC